MKGICIDVGGTIALKEGEQYYLFDHGPNYYVSRFDNIGAHFGSYQKKYFKLIDEQQPEDPEPIIEAAIGDPAKHTHYAAVIEKYRGYGFEVGDVYVIGPTRQDRGTHFYYYTPDDLRFKGCMPQHIFKVLRPYDGIKNDIGVKAPETAQIEAQEDPVIKPLPEVAAAASEPETKQKKAKKEKGVVDGQLSLFDFDFMEG